MGLVEEIRQELQTPLLDMLEGDRAPRFMGRYNVSNNLVNALAHLVATDGNYSYLVRGDAHGHLGVHMLDYRGLDVTDPQSVDWQTVKIGGVAGEAYTMVDSNEEVALNVTSEFLEDIDTVLRDCYDAANHCLLVHVGT
jgi:hypothetical protein